jgi:hypothetical protein
MDFDKLIIDLVRKEETDLDARLESQAEALDDLECTNPVLGRWIDEYDVEYLFAAFNLNDTEFAANFPDLAHLNQHDRSQIIEAFENHFDQCPHCHLKRGYDLEMNGRIERAYNLNNATVAQHLQAAASAEESTAAKQKARANETATTSNEAATSVDNETDSSASEADSQVAAVKGAI